ncbi:23S rRNA (adenine(2030)-N(6))-methyltransferase RlmJ [Lichenibacterium ramalinae]|uniref:Ribosomal RNA large subunit methyltransferase J n=1 Tax=Lichenibacterium ramalinae TaxID=2316527 RepID=A0A4Q2RHF6_9HYPH|nr:23S rRNA (adenine(2030)-N(6))-methyltransferase RlmJ [Lichenibacterium ramalinae]RYB07685.1 23S rRNA (adenine(2030)-N(6))-methyltransferase RlmJ [Lichenibacterium ramalinae]
MNYRHAFHAGNFADVVKHALLARILAYMIAKPAPLRFVDTHAGLGVYDLSGDEASRTGEWRGGIGRLAAAAVPADLGEILAPYLAAVGPAGPDGSWRTYPGSPAVAQWLLRPEDRLTLCELHPEDVETLRANMGRDRRVRVLAGDGYGALNAALPPPERRGLVLIDPPFEKPGEFDALQAALVRAYRKWPTGTYMAWYPLKDRAAVGRFVNGVAVAGLRRILQIHLLVGDPDGGPLAGSGLVVINPPFTLKAEAEALLPWLAATLGRPGEPTEWTARWLAGE